MAIDAVPWTAPRNTIACTGSPPPGVPLRLASWKLPDGFVEAKRLEEVVHDVAEIEGVRHVIFVRRRRERAERDHIAVEDAVDNARAFAPTDHVVAAGAGLFADPVLCGRGLVQRPGQRAGRQREISRTP